MYSPSQLVSLTVAPYFDLSFPSRCPSTHSRLRGNPPKIQWSSSKVDTRSEYQGTRWPSCTGEREDRLITCIVRIPNILCVDAPLTVVSIWRSFSVAESNVPGVADTGISVAGEQTISYDLSDPSTVVQRIDRKDVLGDYWTFQRTLLDVPQSSLVVRSGLDGYACYTSGNTFLFAPPEVPFGYTDRKSFFVLISSTADLVTNVAFYAYVLVRDAWRQSPALVLSFLASNGTLSSTNVKVNGGRDHPAVFDSSRNLTIIFDPDTYLPARIRAYENHPILGPSTNDVMYYNYTTVSGIKFAQNMKMLYNDNLMIQEVLYDTFTVNGNVSSTFFEGLPSAISNETFTGVPPAPAQYSEIFSPAQIFEFSQNFFYAGPYAGKLSNMTVIKPIPSLPNLWHLTFNDNTVYRTTVAVFDDAIMVTDAPPQQSLLVIEWVKEKFNRPVTHLLVTHHHHDHNLGAVDYVNQGAKLVVPARFSYYWDEIEGVQFETAE